MGVPVKGWEPTSLVSRSIDPETDTDVEELKNKQPRVKVKGRWLEAHIFEPLPKTKEGNYCVAILGVAGTEHYIPNGMIRVHSQPILHVMSDDELTSLF